MKQDYIEMKVAAQIARMQEDVKRQREKIQEMWDYLHGNPRNAIAVSYWEPSSDHGGGFEYENEIDFIYIGSVVETKYGDVVKVEFYDAEKELIYFEGRTKPLDRSRISCVHSEEEPDTNLTPEEKIAGVVIENIIQQEESYNRAPLGDGTPFCYVCQAYHLTTTPCMLPR